MTVDASVVTAEFHRQLLEISHQKAMPSDLTFARDVVVRMPWFWLALFENRDVTARHFVTEDLVPGSLAKTFGEAVTRVFSGTEDPPYILPAGQEKDRSELIAQFQSLGVLYSRVALDPSDHVAAIKGVITSCQPGVEAALRIIRSMNARMIDLAGGSGDRYLATRRLDPTKFADDDGEALKRAMMRAEAPIDGRGGPRFKRDRDGKPSSGSGDKSSICRKCGKTFSGSWSEHKKSGTCK